MRGRMLIALRTPTALNDAAGPGSSLLVGASAVRALKLA